MITAVDTSVLLDIFGADPEFGKGSADALRASLGLGSVIACEIVWAETTACFPEPTAAEAALARLRIDFSPLDSSTALATGQRWRTYRHAVRTRERVIADFLIGAHALATSDRLLTRDRGFYRQNFKGLRVLDPSLGRLE
ncbi:MAG: type II toxin-antitoxin system VapC family toxin [Solirubrobacteraceae bacterium]